MTYRVIFFFNTWRKQASIPDCLPGKEKKRKNLQVTGSSLVGADSVWGQGGAWMCLEWRSMSADTSGAHCQVKLSYLETSTPLPQRTNSHL